MERNAMSAPTVTLAPLTGSAVNDMILELMALSGDRRRNELAHFLESGRSPQNEIMITALRGVIVRTTA